MPSKPKPPKYYWAYFSDEKTAVNCHGFSSAAVRDQRYDQARFIGGPERIGSIFFPVSEEELRQSVESSRAGRWYEKLPFTYKTYGPGAEPCTKKK